MHFFRKQEPTNFAYFSAKNEKRYLTTVCVIIIMKKLHRGVAQMVARMVRDHEAASSSLATPTNRSILWDTPIFLFARSFNDTPTKNPPKSLILEDFLCKRYGQFDRFLFFCWIWTRLRLRRIVLLSSAFTCFSPFSAENYRKIKLYKNWSLCPGFCPVPLSGKHQFIREHIG